MNRVGTLIAVASLVGIAAVVGCTSNPPDQPIYSLMGTDPADGGDPGDDDSIKIPDGDDDGKTSSSSGGAAKDAGTKDAGSKDAGTKDAGTSSSSSSSSGGSSSSSSTGGTSSSSSSSSGGTSSSSSGGTSGGDPCLDNTCAAATAEASMSGDTNHDTKNLEGATSHWFSVRVTEDYHSIVFGQPLQFKATLTSPPGANFDLFVYRPDNDVKECTTVRAKSENATGVDTVAIKWGEGADPNGEDDSRTVTVEVREISTATTCDPTALWSLKLEGDTP